jgi:NitT/TauT family transport system permease protein
MKIIPVVVLIAIWFLLAAIVGSTWLPSPTVILMNLWQSVLSDPIIHREGGGSYGFSVHVAATFLRTLFSLIAGCSLGLLVALLGWRPGQVGSLLNIAVETIRVLPPLILIPFFLVIFRSGENGILLGVLCYCTMNFAFYWLSAFRSIPASFCDRASVCKVTLVGFWRAVLLPYSFPQVLSGIKVTVSLTLGVVVVGEYIGASHGLGRVLKYAVSYSSATMIITCIIWAILLCASIEFSIRMLSGSRRGIASNLSESFSADK